LKKTEADTRHETGAVGVVGAATLRTVFFPDEGEE
jgi:hypothetical protein